MQFKITVKAFRFFFHLFVLQLVFFSLQTYQVIAQRPKTRPITAGESKSFKKDAATLFNAGKYDEALKGYQELIAADPTDAELNYRLGSCYLFTNVNKAKAVEYFEISGKAKNSRKETSYYLGLAYMYAERWDDAIHSFENYKTSTRSRLINGFLAVERQIEMCNHAKKLVVNPLQVTFKNLGKFINSPFEDYNPFVSANGKTLVFASRRKGNMGGMSEELGIYPSDIYFSTWKDSAWTKPKNAGAAINSDWDEESVGLSADGKMMLVYLDNTEVYNDIAFSILKGKTWQRLTPFLPPVNSKHVETGASMSLDGSTIYFASDRKDVNGGSDIYRSVKNDNGEWGPAVNLGPVINTVYDEDAPFISMDGKTLYFSSMGHNSMGGYDVFRSVLDESSGTWSDPVNIGYPVNDADDNLFFSMTGDQRRAFVSAVRPDGLGDRDLYEVTYIDTNDHPFSALISGIVSSALGVKLQITKATLTDKSTKKILMTYKPSVPGNEFVLSANPGDYVLSIEGTNFKPYHEDLVIAHEFPLKDMMRIIKVENPEK